MQCRLLRELCGPPGSRCWCGSRGRAAGISDRTARLSVRTSNRRRPLRDRFRRARPTSLLLEPAERHFALPRGPSSRRGVCPCGILAGSLRNPRPALFGFRLHAENCTSIQYCSAHVAPSPCGGRHDGAKPTGDVRREISFHLLRDTSLSVSEAAAASRDADAAVFSRAFRLWTGMSRGNGAHDTGKAARERQFCLHPACTPLPRNDHPDRPFRSGDWRTDCPERATLLGRDGLKCEPMPRRHSRGKDVRGGGCGG